MCERERETDEGRDRGKQVEVSLSGLVHPIQCTVMVLYT